MEIAYDKFILFKPVEKSAGFFFTALITSCSEVMGAFLCPKGGVKNNKKFFENLFILPCKFPNWLSRDKTSSTLTTEYTFNKYIPDRSIMLSRMKVRQEPPARKGYYGKQGG